MTPEQMQLVQAGEGSSERKTIAHNLFAQEWKKNNHRGTFEGATGTGKTRAAIMLMAEELQANPDACIYLAVPTETLRDKDWPAEFDKWGFPELKDKVRRVCWVSLDKERPDGEVDLFVADEFHHLTPSNAAFFDRVLVWKMIGLTATIPAGTKNKEEAVKVAMMKKLAPSVFKITLEEGIALELVAEFEVKVLYHELDKKDMYIDAGTKARPAKTTEASHYLYLTKLMQKMAYTKNENAKFVYIQKRTALLKNLRSKTRIAKALMQTIINGTQRTLIFAGSIDQCNELCGEYVYHSKTDDKALELFQEKKIHYCGAVDALNEGKNVEDLDQLFIVQGNSVDRVLIQRAGRSVRWRPNHKALIVVLVTKGTADEKWFNTASAGFNKKRITKYSIGFKEDGTTLDITKLAY